MKGAVKNLDAVHTGNALEKIKRSNETKAQSVRKSNIELLRMVAMLFIITFHYVYKSGYTFEELSVNSFIVKVFWLLGELGVNLFILITGYFMVKGKFSFKKLIYLILEVNFYYWGSVLIADKLGILKEEKTLRDYCLMFFPTISNQYWFITSYILVYIISPYLNMLIQHMEKKTYQKMLFTVILLWSVIPTILGIFQNTTENLLYYTRFVWMIIMYFIGAYIRIYGTHKKITMRIVLSFGVMVAGIFIIYKFRNIFNKLGTKEVAYFWTPNTIPMFILSVAFFELFLKIDIGSNRIINKLASTTLGIYMIHDGVLNTYIWGTIFKTKEHLESSYSIISILLSAIVIFLVGAIIDFIRQWLEKNIIVKLLNSKTSKKIGNKFSKVCSKIIDII